MKKKHYFIVSVRAGEASAADTRRYVKEAVESWGGGYHHENPFFSPKVTVRGLFKKEAKK